MTPLEESIEIPGGGVPDEIDQVSGVAVVGAAVTVCEYAAFTTPFGNEVVVMTGGILIVKDCVAFWGGLPLSVARTVNVKLPVMVGVPLMTPPLERVNPDGNEPEMTDQLYG